MCEHKNVFFFQKRYIFKTKFNNSSLFCFFIGKFIFEFLIFFLNIKKIKKQIYVAKTTAMISQIKWNKKKVMVLM